MRIAAQNSGAVRLAGFEGVPETSHDFVGAFGRPQDVDDLDKVTADQLLDVAEDRASCPAHQPDAEFRVDQVHADRGGVKEGLEPSVALAHRLFGPLAVGDVLDGEQDRRSAHVHLPERPGIENHRPFADVLELAFHREVVDLVVPGQDLPKEPAQVGDVPLAVAQLEQEPVFRLLRRGAKRLVERAAGGLDAQVLVQYQQRFAHRCHDALGVRVGAFEQVHIDQHHDHAVDLVLQGPVRAEPQRVPASVLVPDVAFLDADRVEHLREQRLQVGEVVEVELDVGRAAGPRRWGSG